MTASRQTYETMNGLRGVAALAITISHMFSFFWTAMAASGYLAVDFFFARSGFVLAGAYGDKLKSGALTTQDFALKRLLRFYPLYLIGLALGVVQAVAENLMHLGNPLPLDQIGWALLCALVFLPTLAPGSFYITPLNGPAWSLLFEYWVNVAWARLSRRAPFWIYPILLVAAAAGFLWGAILKGDAGVGPFWVTVPGGIGRTVFSFTAGLLIYRYRGGAHGRRVGWSVALMAGLFGLLFIEPVAGLRLPYDLLFVFLLSPLIVFLASTMEPPASFRRAFALLGQLSFPLYAMHFPVIAAGIIVTRKLHIPPAMGGVLVLATAIAAAFVMDRVDVRLRRWIEDRDRAVSLATYA